MLLSASSTKLTLERAGDVEVPLGGAAEPALAPRAAATAAEMSADSCWAAVGARFPRGRPPVSDGAGATEAAVRRRPGPVRLRLADLVDIRAPKGPPAKEGGEIMKLGAAAAVNGNFAV